MAAGKSFGLKDLMTNRHQQDEVRSVIVFVFKFPGDLFPEEPDMQDCFDSHPVELNEDDLQRRQNSFNQKMDKFLQGCEEASTNCRCSEKGLLLEDDLVDYVLDSPIL